MKSLPILCFFLFFSTPHLFSQKLKWGKIPAEDLKMTVFPIDPQAAAMVLDELGELTFQVTDNNIRYKLDVHVRMKILSQAGFDQGDIKIPFYSKDNDEKMGDLDLQVFSPDGEKIKVKDKNIFEEKVDDDYSQVRFAVPNLQVGTVFEYRYSRKTGKNGTGRAQSQHQPIVF